ncbi:hypothetical protein [Thiohalophilus sp.]|nr:hypothetical protein [Thiohalophilus sp.]MDZ7805273.1 hypothetical protein [Thiohalophilus sp.]
MYRNQFDALELCAMYSADPSSDNITGYTLTDNDVNASYKGIDGAVAMS